MTFLQGQGRVRLARSVIAGRLSLMTLVCKTLAFRLAYCVTSKGSEVKGQQCCLIMRSRSRCFVAVHLEFCAISFRLLLFLHSSSYIHSDDESGTGVLDDEKLL